MATGPSLEETALALLADQPPLLVLDMQGVTFCDSSGIASLIRIQRAASDQDSGLELRFVRGLVRSVLELAGVSDLLGVRGEEQDQSEVPDATPDPPR